jgi:hypothetical protein
MIVFPPDLHRAVVAQGVVLRKATNLKSDGTVLHDAAVSVSAASDELLQEGIRWTWQAGAP